MPRCFYFSYFACVSCVIWELFGLPAGRLWPTMVILLFGVHSLFLFVDPSQIPLVCKSLRSLCGSDALIWTNLLQEISEEFSGPPQQLPAFLLAPFDTISSPILTSSPPPSSSPSFLSAIVKEPQKSDKDKIITIVKEVSANFLSNGMSRC